MKKKTSSRTTSKKTKTIKHVLGKKNDCDCGSLTCSDCNPFWGKDQPMIMLLSASIIVLVVAGMYLAGWL